MPKTKHNCGCISQVRIYKGIFRFWSALCGLLGDKCSIASSSLVHKTSTVHMAFFNSLRGAKQLLREANNPRNGAKQILGDSKHLLRETKQILRDSKQLLRETNKPSNGAIQIQTLGKVTENLLWETIFRYNVINSHNIAFNGIQSENFLDKTCGITRNQIRQANHILAMYMIMQLLKNKFILKSTNYFETNNASTKIVPRIDYKKGYSYHVSNQPKVCGCSENHRHSLSCLNSVCHKPRDREPSRISLKKVIKLRKCRKFRKKRKRMLVKGIPVSSVLYDIATNYNHWRLKYIRSNDSFYSYYFKAVRKVSVMYNTTKQTLLLSGDVELNPGPLTDNTINDVCCYNNSDFTLRYRMLRHGLIPLDVGGEGDCFFRSVSHQLYGNSKSRLTIRSLGVRYLKDNPERFIESIAGMSWSRYLTNMSLQGTWENHIIIQAVADAMNLKFI